MAIRAADLPGSRVTRQQYVKPDDPFVASYEREFAVLTVKLGTKRLLGLESDVNLASSASEAHSYIALISLGLALIDPKTLANAFKSGSGGIRATYVRLGRLVKLRVGDEAYELTIRLGTKVGELRLLLIFVRVNRVVDLVIAAGAPRATVGIPQALALARLTAAHSHDGLVPINTSLPVVSGTAAVGQTLTAAPGTWSNKPTGFAYAWQRCDASGAGCTDTGVAGQTYALSAADAGSAVRVQVTATNAVGPGRAFSAVTSVVAGPPQNTALPTITGTAAVGQTLTATAGSWTGSPTSFAYQWRRCDQAGATCADIAEAIAQAYVVTPADVGATLRVAVTATNGSGSAVAVSAPTTTVSG